ncbi:type I DNA topoisomerase [bacterium]|nr:type I DNA topoisomerase [bacterium]
MSDKKLVIVESPTKAKTLTSILSKEYSIKASNGHIRDLPKSGLGVDVDNNFEPEYEVPPKAKKTLTALKKSAKTADQILLATDPDREGEAIAWHLQVLLTPKKGKKPNFGRVVFHELTKSAIEHAFEDPGKVNDNLVDAQQARRILDRLVGYKLSPLLWKKVRYGLSAGRVQSVAVRLIVEKERERDEFKSEEYWDISGMFEDSSKKRDFEGALAKKDGKKLEVKTSRGAKKIDTELKDDSFKIAEVKKAERKKKPHAPFKTSTLQQSMASAFGFTARRTMSASQGLFEKGYITYHRTDSITLSKKFVEKTRSFVKKEIDAKYIPDKPPIYKSKSKGAQEAHEAIRPTKLSRNPATTKLTADEGKVYMMIWKRSVESQMVSAVYDQTTLLVGSGKGYEFRASGSVIKFEGWLAVGRYLGMEENGNSDGIHVLPEYSEGEKVLLKELKTEQKFTQPPARYNDASLVKMLEELGIGRPSTYAPTISTIIRRGYVVREGRAFIPQDVAYVVIDLLVEHFPDIVDYEFTAGMEEDLDDIAEGKKEWVPIIKEFYKPFEKTLEKKDKELHKRDVTTLEETDEVCPECKKHKLVVKLGKYGKFLSCSGYPDCDYAKPLAGEDGEEAKEDYGKCPECEDGVFVLKQGRFGKFLACNNYPKCKTTKPYMDKIGVKCPGCGEGDVVVKKAKKKTFYGCSKYPDCDWSSWTKPKG